MNVNALQMVALGLGGVGVVAGMWAQKFPERTQEFCRGFPRNERIGRVLMLVDMAWSLYLFHKMNLGGWNQIKPVTYALSPLIYWFIITYVNQYLGARSLALFLILAAKPLVWICFLRDEPSRLVITTLAYVWVVLGICFFAAPHWLRDVIHFWQASPGRWAFGCRAKVVAGLGLIALGLFVY